MINSCEINFCKFWMLKQNICVFWKKMQTDMISILIRILEICSKYLKTILNNIILLHVVVNMTSFPQYNFQLNVFPLFSSCRPVSWWPCATPSSCPLPSSPWQPPAQCSPSKAPLRRPPPPSHPPLALRPAPPLDTPPPLPVLPPHPPGTQLFRRAAKALKTSVPPCTQI